MARDLLAFPRTHAERVAEIASLLRQGRWHIDGPVGPALPLFWRCTVADVEAAEREAVEQVRATEERQ